MTQADLSDRVRDRLSKEDLPRPYAVMLHPQDFHGLMIESWDRGERWSMAEQYVLVKPMDGIPKGALAWKLAPFDEARTMTI